ncbi:hypothetical protein FB45DRAFT_981293 [Roridomyces roridus]|uniref:DUF6593 domain-containing protein n=1 Tax=Roridomyces roridus TaxID=1738132 RepID=A0AAD7BCJ6_9AGAR|nr:hypothetical protein FB45DRAFT_983355 [Roridomyces roridus]KAJ7617026.1 hypothetical protein FB45DRAFT_981293 [Roridomyces roridus]
MSEEAVAIPRVMTLELATNSVRNTTFSTSDDDPYYEVVTRFWHPHVTKINKLDLVSGAMNTVCEINNEGSDVKIRFASNDPDKITVEPVQRGKKTNGPPLGEWVSTESILKLAPERPGGIFTDSDGTRYRWKTHNRNLLLIRCDDDTRLPVAVYHRYKRHLGFWRMRKHAQLEIKQPDVIKNMEGLIATYLLVERQRRHPISLK